MNYKFKLFNEDKLYNLLKLSIISIENDNFDFVLTISDDNNLLNEDTEFKVKFKNSEIKIPINIITVKKNSTSCAILPIEFNNALFSIESKINYYKINKLLNRFTIILTGILKKDYKIYIVDYNSEIVEYNKDIPNKNKNEKILLIKSSDNLEKDKILDEINLYILNCINIFSDLYFELIHKLYIFSDKTSYQMKIKQQKLEKEIKQFKSDLDYDKVIEKQIEKEKEEIKNDLNDKEEIKNDLNDKEEIKNDLNDKEEIKN